MELEPTNPAQLLDAIAGSVFQDLLTVELAAEHLLTERPQSGPTSFIGHFMFAVEDVRAAGVIIRAVLHRNDLESYAAVFQLCPEEMVWKSMYPEGLTMLNEHFAAECVALSAKSRDTLAVWKQALKEASPPSNDTAGQ